MSDELWQLLRETAAVQRLIDGLTVSDRAGTTTPEQEREYRLRRAVLAQRHLELAESTGSDPEEAAADAEQTAVMLWKHDALHGSHRGRIPATAPAWKASNASEYVRQEAAAAAQGREER